MTQSKGHPHAALMLEYAKDAAEHAEPWLLWQYRMSKGSWHTFENVGPRWEPNLQYRRIPRTIRIGEIDVSEPMRVAPQAGAYYYVATTEYQELCYQSRWDGDSQDHARLARGLVHLTREAAEAHARALIAVSGGDV